MITAGVLNVKAKYNLIVNSNSTSDIVVGAIIGIEVIVTVTVILMNILK